MRCIYSILVALLALTTLSLAALAEGPEPSARSGEVVFDAHCANCHSGGIGGFFSGAPDIDDAGDWEELTPKGLDALTTNTITGIGEMAARGACADCSDEDIRAAVEYMLDKSQE